MRKESLARGAPRARAQVRKAAQHLELLCQISEGGGGKAGRALAPAHHARRQHNLKRARRRGAAGAVAAATASCKDVPRGARAQVAAGAGAAAAAARRAGQVQRLQAQVSQQAAQQLQQGRGGRRCSLCKEAPQAGGRAPRRPGVLAQGKGQAVEASVHPKVLRAKQNPPSLAREGLVVGGQLPKVRGREAAHLALKDYAHAALPLQGAPPSQRAEQVPLPLPLPLQPPPCRSSAKGAQVRYRSGL